jgi:bifunctional enzyme CysN/CysC
VVVAVNKMDLVDFSEGGLDSVVTEYKAFLQQIGLEARTFVPISARNGFNVEQSGAAQMPWYKGPTITSMLDQFEPPKGCARSPAAFPRAGCLSLR